MFLAGISFMSVQAQSGSAAPVSTSVDQAVKMTKDKYDIGKIPQGEPYNFDMEFTNETKKPLVIKSVMASCGCTVPEKPTQPIMPGKTGKIKVSYSAPSLGPVNKDIEIYVAGYNEPKTVYFTGEVIAKK